MSSEKFLSWCQAEAERCGIGWFGRHEQVGDELLHYVAAGTGQPLVLIHGFMAWSYTWVHNLRPLSEYCQVLAPDLRGYGLSHKNHRLSHSLDDQVEVVRAFLDHLNIDQAVLCGHSMGGEVALRLALKYPTRVRGLVLVAASSYVVSRDRPLQRFLLKTPGVGPLAVRAAVMNRRYVVKSLQFCFHDQSKFTPADVDAYYLPARSPSAAAAFARTVLDLDFGKWSNRWSEVEHPALLVWGANDPLIPLAHGERLAKALPNSRLVVFDQCGHVPHAEHPSTFNQEVLGFLSGLDQGGC